VFGQVGFVSLLQVDVALVLLDPDLNGMISLPSVDLTAFSWHTVHTRSFESQVTLHMLKEPGDLFQG
jgi:hypothetical protein